MRCPVAPDPSAALRQIREATDALVAEGRPAEAVEYSLSALAAVLDKVTELEGLLRRLRREQLGTRSERIPADQLALLLAGAPRLEGPEPPADRVAETQQDAVLEQAIAAQRAARPNDGRPARRGRLWHARQIARQVHQVALPEAERRCGTCGRPQRRIGEDVTRRLEYVPAHFIEHEYHQAKYACGTCKVGVRRGTAPAAGLERSVADPSVLAQVVVSKFVDHTPLHRQHRIYGRSGVDISVSTLADWVAGVAERVAPLVEVLTDRVRHATVVRTDSTGLPVLDPTSPEHVERGTIWCYVGDDRDVVFRYTPTGAGASGPWEFLAGRRGYVQADAASVFDRLFTGQAASAIEVGCWAHARRKFVALVETDCRVAYPLQLIRRLYRLEELATVEGRDPGQRAALRGEHSVTVLDTLQRWLLTLHGTEPPGSELAKAVAYTLKQWIALTRFVADGRLALDNNVCEQQLRDLALGRKNFLFAGSHEAAHRTAVLYSLMRTCAQHGVPPLPYLTDVLRQLATESAPDLRELLPDQWRRRQPALAPIAPLPDSPTAPIPF